MINVNLNELIALTDTLCRIPAPSNHEELRAEFCEKYFKAFGADNAYTDEALNVILPYCCDEFEDIAVIMAHTDTVFPDMEPFAPEIRDNVMYCPGVADDTVHLAYLMLAAKSIVTGKLKPSCGLIFVANSGEEGLGNLKGVRAVMKKYGSRVKEFISLDAQYNKVVKVSVGSHRYKISCTAQGGHSYSAFGNSNAIHALSSLVCRLYDIKIPQVEGETTTYNVGIINGGTSVNTIAQSAEMLYEYRSTNRECLAYMKNEFEKIYSQLQSELAEKGVEFKAELLGDRPCGGDIDPEKQEALMERCKKALEKAYGEEIFYSSSSTDCNIPMSMGIPSTCFGIVKQAGTHKREEHMFLDYLPGGIRAANEILSYYFK